MQLPANVSDDDIRDADVSVDVDVAVTDRIGAADRGNDLDFPRTCFTVVQAL